MKVEQLKPIKDSYYKEATRPDGRKSTMAEYIKVSLDGGIDVVTSKDLVVFDDDNEVVHAVCINEDMRAQASYPVKIISSDYSMIQQVECVMSQKNFESFINDGFLSNLLSDDKKKAMIKWTRGITNQAQQPLEAEPYFNTNPKIIPMAHSKIERDEPYTNPATSIVGSDGEVRNYDSIVDAINDIRDGDIIKIEKDVVIDMDNETVFKFDKPITATIDLNGNTLSSKSTTLFNISDGSITINNGSIKTNGEVFRIVPANDSTIPSLVLGEDLTVVSDNDCCILTKGISNITTAANLTSLSKDYAAVQGSGNTSKPGSVINIIGGNIISNNNIAIYHPQNGILNISPDVMIKGAEALYIKSGEININGGSFIGTADSSPYSSNNNGANDTGDAVVIDFCDYPGGDPVVNISGGTFSSIDGFALSVYDKYGILNPEGAENFVSITGGTFDTVIDKKYVPEGYEIISNNNSFYVSAV